MPLIKGRTEIQNSVIIAGSSLSFGDTFGLFNVNSLPEAAPLIEGIHSFATASRQKGCRGIAARLPKICCQFKTVLRERR